MSDPGVRLVCVVIPYFQREAGVLRRALLSVGAQRLPAEMKVHCIIVDDGSPHSADGEIPELAEHTRVSFSIVRQANGGVSAARNAALDHVPAEASFVACLDSDDIWGPLHLARAIEALDGGADFYFSDCLLDERGTWFSTMPDFEHLLASYCVAETADLAILQADALLASFVEDCPAHTSSTVYRFERYRLVRFERALRNAGEDHLFWFDLVRSADRVAVDRQATVSRGHGN